MGACGYFLSKESVFYVTAALSVPALFWLARIREEEIDPVRAHAGVPRRHPANLAQGLRRVASNRLLLLFAVCIALFHLANAAMLPLVSGMITMRSSNWATLLVAACIVMPQLVVAAFSPRVGRAARHWGRRPLLLLAFAVLPLRGLLLAVVTQPFLLCLVQALDGISAAVLGVLVPVVVADLTRNTGRFNLSQGVVGTGSASGPRSARRLPDTLPIISEGRRRCSVSRAQEFVASCFWRPGCPKPTRLRNDTLALDMR